MADLEAVLADVSYLMAMEKSKSTPAARASKKIILPDPRYITQRVTNTLYTQKQLKFISSLPYSHPHSFIHSFIQYSHSSVRSVMHRYLEKMCEVTFDKMFNQKLGKSSSNPVNNIFEVPHVFLLLLVAQTVFPVLSLYPFAGKSKYCI